MGPTSEQYRYTLPEKAQKEKFPSDVKFPPNKVPSDSDIELQYNDSIMPTTAPTEKIESHNNKSNTSYKNNPGSDQIDMAHPNKSATINKFSNIRSIAELLKKSEVTKETIEIPKEEMAEGIKIEEEHKPTVTDIYEKLISRKPTEEEATDAYKNITLDHEVETVNDLTKEPNYYKFLTDMEDEMKNEGK